MYFLVISVLMVRWSLFLVRFNHFIAYRDICSVYICHAFGAIQHSDDTNICAHGDICEGGSRRFGAGSVCVRQKLFILCQKFHSSDDDTVWYVFDAWSRSDKDENISKATVVTFEHGQVVERIVERQMVWKHVWRRVYERIAVTHACGTLVLLSAHTS